MEILDRAVSVLDEPALRFGFGQSLPNPKAGLFLFGPLREHSNPTEIRCGVIGTPAGIRAYRSWVERIGRAIAAVPGSKTSVFYPGFKELFNCAWSATPAAEIPMSATEIAATLHRSDRHDAVHATVGLFSEAINDFLRD